VICNEETERGEIYEIDDAPESHPHHAYITSTASKQTYHGLTCHSRSHNNNSSPWLFSWSLGKIGMQLTLGIPDPSHLNIRPVRRPSSLPVYTVVATSTGQSLCSPQTCMDTLVVYVVSTNIEIRTH